MLPIVPFCAKLLPMLLTTREVAALLRVHPKQVDRLLRRGLPARRVGGEWRFSREEVLAWGGAGPPETPASGPAPLVAANEDLIVDLLLGALSGSPGPLLGRIAADSGQGLELLARGAAVVAGHHGGPPPSLPGVRLVRLALFERELGLVYPRRRGAPALADLGRVRFADRPEGAGSRVHLDAALRRQGLDPARLHARARGFPSPADAACAVARGDADAGLSTRAWAARLGLGFTALVHEPYALLIRAARGASPSSARAARRRTAHHSPRLASMRSHQCRGLASGWGLSAVPCSS